MVYGTSGPRWPLSLLDLVLPALLIRWKKRNRLKIDKASTCSSHCRVSASAATHQHHQHHQHRPPDQSPHQENPTRVYGSHLGVFRFGSTRLAMMGKVCQRGREWLRCIGRDVPRDVPRGFASSSPTTCKVDVVDAGEGPAYHQAREGTYAFACAWRGDIETSRRG